LEGGAVGGKRLKRGCAPGEVAGGGKGSILSLGAGSWGVVTGEPGSGWVGERVGNDYWGGGGGQGRLMTRTQSLATGAVRRRGGSGGGGQPIGRRVVIGGRKMRGGGREECCRIALLVTLIRRGLLVAMGVF